MTRRAAAPAEGRDVLAFIGETGAGKTTCIRHFLDDNLELTELQTPHGPRTVIDSPDGCHKEFAIGHAASSTRTVATIHEPRTDLLIVDLPGDNDTGAVFRCCCSTHCCVPSRCANAKSVRLVYLDMIDNFAGARGKSYFQQGLGPLTEVFRDGEDAKDSALLLFSPVARTGGDLQRLISDPRHVLMSGVLMELSRVQEWEGNKRLKKCETVWVCGVVRFAKKMVSTMEKYT